MEQILADVTAVALPVILAVTLHEAAHGFVAWRLGDDTAWRLGRVTFNPIRHIDPVGTIILPTVMYFSTHFLFGWAKPVPVSFGRLRHPRRDMVWVALAGPGGHRRQASALLHHLGLDRLVGTDVAGYVDIATSLALSAEDRTRAAGEVSASLASSAVFDPSQFAAAFDEALLEIIGQTP